MARVHLHFASCTSDRVSNDGKVLCITQRQGCGFVQRNINYHNIIVDIFQREIRIWKFYTSILLCAFWSFSNLRWVLLSGRLKGAWFKRTEFELILRKAICINGLKSWKSIFQYEIVFSLFGANFVNDRLWRNFDSVSEWKFFYLWNGRVLFNNVRKKMINKFIFSLMKIIKH